MRWRIIKKEGVSLELLVQPDNGREDLVLHCSSWEAARAYIEEEDDKEEAATAALCSEDPLALCRVGWHIFRDRSGRGMYFRVAGRFRDSNRTIVYRSGRAPFEYDCKTVSCRDGVAWFCEACEQFVDEAEVGGGAEVDGRVDGRAEA